jgi:hypothetical protein
MPKLLRFTATIFLTTCWFIFNTASAKAATYYVSKNGNNTSPTTGFSTGWSELNQIQWSSIGPGDTILLDGGTTACLPVGLTLPCPAGVSCPASNPYPSCGMKYTTALNISANGSSTNPITIKLGSSGTAIIDGGVNVNTASQCSEYLASDDRGNLPIVSGSGTRSVGVNFGSSQYVILDGTKWGGIEIRNHTQYGINISSGKNNQIKYVKVHHNTNPTDTANSSVGITQGYLSDGNLVYRSEIFRNGQDATRGAGDNFTLTENYLHDQYCNHPDGIQAFIPTGNCDIPNNAGQILNMTISRNIFERVGLQPIFLGENNILQDPIDNCPSDPPGHDSWVDTANIYDNLLIYGHDMIKSKNSKTTKWNVHHNTLYQSSGWAIELCCASPGSTSPMSVTNNIFHTTPDGSDSQRQSSFYLSTSPSPAVFDNNCLYQTRGSVPPGSNNLLNTNPQFRNIASGDFSLLSTSACLSRGSGITSVGQLINLSGSPTISPSPTPANTSPTPTPVPGACIISNTTSWQSGNIPTQTGVSTIEFDATPVSVGNVVIGLSNSPATDFTSLAIPIRFFTNNQIEAMNGTLYTSTNPITYVPNTTYHFRIIFNLNIHKYSVFVKPGSGNEILLADNFAFRTDQASVSSLSNWNIKAVSGQSNLCSVASDFYPGDVNHDGVLNGTDMRLILGSWLTTGACNIFNCDLNQDQKVNAWDTVKSFFSLI